MKKDPAPEYDISNLTFPVVTVSVADIRKAMKTKSVSESSKRQLVIIPNVNQRSRIYGDTAVAIADREAAALPSHGGRNWTCNVVISDTGGAIGDGVNSNHGSLEQGRRSSSASSAFQSTAQSSSNGGRGGQKRKKKDYGPLFRWYRGNLELACLPHLFEKIDILDDGGPYNDNDSDDPLVSYKKTDMQERQITSMSTWAWENPSYPAPIIKRKWLSPDHVIFNSRISALQHAAELLRRDKLIDRVLFGFGSRGVELRPMKPTKKDSLEAGYYRFLRDGLWVIGQEEDWLEERLQKWNTRVLTNNLNVETKMENTTNMYVPTLHHELSIVNNQGDKVDPVTTVDDVGSTILDPCDSNHNSGKSEPFFISSHQEQGEETIEKLSSLSAVDVATHDNRTIIHSIHADDRSFEQKPEAESDIPITASYHIQEIETSTNTVNTRVNDSLGNADDNLLMVTPLDSGSEHSSMNGGNQHPTQLENKKSIELNHPSSLISKRENACDKNNVTTPSFISDAILPTNDDMKPRRTKTLTIKSIAPSNHWRLTANEIEACSDAIQEHFQRVMYTIKMKQLHSELADGFDIIRERGRGRYDMQIPLFDDSKFDFLTNLKTARWMPVIRQILGDDATLVHKGSFLSLPGSDAQVYHQDGPHLTTKYQRSCHAVNVFIPLVDLYHKNGPTEFCLGTHILGYEYHSKEMLYTPTVKAGTPIIFDYRLGHRGLGNSSHLPRPIVYLTYTSASKEFRDQINFSTKRYRKFGEILDLPVSREERARKRIKVVDDNKMDLLSSDH